GLAGCQGPAASTPPPKPAAGGAAPAGAAAAPTAAPAAAPVQATPDLVRVADVQALNGGGLYVALDKGYFREQGLDVRLENLTGGADAVPFLSTGDLDLALGNVS